MNDRISGIRERIDLLEEVIRYGGRVGRESGETTYLHCPDPGHDDANPSFTVRAGHFRCWSQCDRQGDVIDLVAWQEGCSNAEAVDRLAERLGINRTSKRSRWDSDADVLSGFLHSRGWDHEVARVLGLAVVPDRYGRARVRFPFRLRGRVVYHQDRAVGGTPGLRWLSANGRTPCPYEADRLSQAHQRGHVLVCEGLSDVAAIVNIYEDPAVVGIPGVGGFKKDWAPAFKGLTVWVVADRDPAGEGFRKLLEKELSPVASVGHIHVPEPYGDLDDWIRGVGAVRFDVLLDAAEGMS